MRYLLAVPLYIVLIIYIFGSPRRLTADGVAALESPLQQNKSLALVWEPSLACLEPLLAPRALPPPLTCLLPWYVSMTQPVLPVDPSDISSPQDKAWNHLLALEAQVQATQDSLTHHTMEFTGLHQTMDTISQSL